MIEARFRSIDTWPYGTTRERRSRYTFKATWGSTLNLLDRELDHLDAHDVVIECGLRPSDIRVDGWPRENARQPTFPGVAVHFDSPTLGHLRYATDTCEWWQHNVRSIALGLQALRAVDRYGITRGGEQYRGFGELPSGIAVPAAKMSVEKAANYILGVCEGAGAIVTETSTMLDDLSRGFVDGLDGAYRWAAKVLHPDAGGAVEDFQRLQEAKAVLDAFARRAS